MDDIEQTFNRVKRLDYKSMLSILHRNNLNLYQVGVEYYEPHPRVKDAYEQACLENGWTLKDFVNEVNIRLFGHKIYE